MRLDNLALTRIVWLVGIVGLALALLFAVMSVARNWETSRQMETSVHLVQFSVDLSSLVHELKAERSASAVCLASNGTRLGPEMREQREKADAVRAVVVEELHALVESGEGESVASSLDHLEKQFAALDTIRQRIDRQEISRADQVEFYTATTHESIALVGKVAAGVSDPSIAKQMLVYSSLQYGKDTAGLERAVGATGFAQGRFSPQLAQKLQELRASEDTYFQFAEELARPAVRDELHAILASPTSDRIKALRVIASSGDPARIGAIGTADWIDAQTTKL